MYGALWRPRSISAMEHFQTKLYKTTDLRGPLGKLYRFQAEKTFALIKMCLSSQLMRANKRKTCPEITDLSDTMRVIMLLLVLTNNMVT